MAWGSDDNQEGEVEAVGFAYVVMSLMFVMVLVPMTIHYVNKFIKKGSGEAKKGACSCKGCKAKTLKEETENYKQGWRSWKFMLFILLWVVFIGAVVMLSVDANKSGSTEYNPFAILGLEEGADERAVKKAYRKMSLKWHPDANPDDPAAHEMFIKLQKAYNALTDPVQRENYEKYGHPDGPRSFGFATKLVLPELLQNKKNAVLYLGILCILFFFVLPLSIYLWWRTASKKSDLDLMEETIKLLFFHVSENMSPKLLPGVICLAEEFKLGLKFDQRDVKDVTIMESKMGQKSDFGGSMISHKKMFWGKKSYLLLRSYFERFNDIPERYVVERRMMVGKLHQLIAGITMVCFSFLGVLLLCMQTTLQRQQMRKTRGLGLFLHAAVFAQMSTQAISNPKDSIRQVPHVREDILRQWRRRGIMTVRDLLRKGLTERATLFEETCSHWTPAKIANVERMLAFFPKMKMKVEVGTLEVKRNDEEEKEKGKVEEEGGSGEEGKIDKKEDVDPKEEEEAKEEVPRAKEFSVQADAELMLGKKVTQESLVTVRVHIQRLGIPVLPPRKRKKGGNKSKNPVEIALSEEEIAAREAWECPEEPWLNVHCPHFPEKKKEVWFVIVASSKHRRVLDFKREVLEWDNTLEFRFPVGRELGIQKYMVYLRSDSYLGADLEEEFSFNVEKKEEVEESEEESSSGDEDATDSEVDVDDEFSSGDDED